MTPRQAITYKLLFDVGDVLGRQITYAKSSAHSLELPDAVTAKLIEAQQAVFAAQRMMETLK